jgi:hypothetical protein
MTGGVPARANRASFQLGATSTQATPEVNLGHTLQGHNAAIAGYPLYKVRTGAIAEHWRQWRPSARRLPQNCALLGHKSTIPRC